MEGRREQEGREKWKGEYGSKMVEDGEKKGRRWEREGKEEYDHTQLHLLDLPVTAEALSMGHRLRTPILQILKFPKIHDFFCKL